MMLNFSKPLSVLLSICLSTAIFSQTRIIPHVSLESGGFKSKVILANTDHTEAHTVSLMPYGKDGTQMNAVSIAIDAGVTEYKGISDLFSTSEVSHFIISGDSQIEVHISYQSIHTTSSPVHIHESSVQASGWRIYPGNWDIVWDGLAMVNMGADSSNIKIVQRSANGGILATYTGLTDVQSNEKVLYVLSTDFTASAGSYYEIVSNQPLSIVSLRGTYNWSEYQFLWENSPINVPVDFDSEHLTLLKTIDLSPILSPNGDGVIRPDVIGLNDILYFAYGIVDQRNFHRVKLQADLDLTLIEGPRELFSGNHDFAIDIRVSKGNGEFWYAFEDNKYRSSITDTHFLNAAWYSGNELIGKQTDIASGITTGIPDAFAVDPNVVPQNPEATDDPTPLWFNNSYYVFTRAWSGFIEEYTPNTKHHIRVYNQNFEKTDDFLLDTSTAIPGKTLSQNTLIDIEGQVFLIGGFYNSRDDIPGGSAVYAVPLSNDLKYAIDDEVPLLTEPGKWFFKVTAARTHNEKLYINYQAILSGYSTQHIAVFDMEHHYSLLKSVELSRYPLGDGIMANHTTFEIMNDRVFVFYPGSDHRIYVNIYTL